MESFVACAAGCEVMEESRSLTGSCFGVFGFLPEATARPLARQRDQSRLGESVRDTGRSAVSQSEANKRRAQGKKQTHFRRLKSVLAFRTEVKFGADERN